MNGRRFHDATPNRKGAKKAGRSTGNITIKTVLEELEQSGRRLRKSNKGYRALLRETLETAQRIIMQFENDETLRDEFVRAVNKKRVATKAKGTLNWPLEVVSKATGASSRKARKLASKRSLVLEYLRKRNVPVNETAVLLKKEGLEKLYSECRKAKKAKPTPAPVSQRRSTPSDKQVTLCLWMERSDRDRLLSQELGTKLSVLVSRVSEDDGDFLMKGAIVVNGFGEEADEWSE